MAVILVNFSREVFSDVSGFNMDKYDQYYTQLYDFLEYPKNRNLKIIWLSNDHMYSGLIKKSHYIISNVIIENIFTNTELTNLLDSFDIEKNNTIYFGGGKLNKSFLCVDAYITKFNFVFLNDLLLFDNKNNLSSSEIKILNSLSELPNVTFSTTNTLINKWGCGDTFKSYINFPEDTFAKLKTQVSFHKMLSRDNYVPREISIQYIKPIDNTLKRPIYRHPYDVEPINVEMCEIVKNVLSIVEKKTNIIGLNHVLIQLYRNGEDNISSHSDKTLDIDPNTPIINVSFGAKREMTIELKDNKNIKQKIPLLNNEILVFGLKTNKKWRHEIKKKTDCFVGERISLTFRKINTFVTHDNIVVGQGSPYKNIYDITKIIFDKTSCVYNKQLMFDAFSIENKSSKFEWDDLYKNGYLIL